MSRLAGHPLLKTPEAPHEMGLPSTTEGEGTTTNEPASVRCASTYNVDSNSVAATTAVCFQDLNHIHPLLGEIRHQTVFESP